MGASKKMYEQQKLEDKAQEEQSQVNRDKCSTGRCRYGSYITSSHPCKVQGQIKLQCKHPK